jgi:excisionase family DNA binding protein
MKNGIFTVDQVAEMLDLHPKTIRRFIREGKLKARKVGGQWRIMEHDITLFMGDDQVRSRGRDKIPDIQDSTGKTPKNMPNKVQVSSIVDVFVENAEEASRISNTLLAVMNSKDPAYGNARCDHVFYKDEGKVRVILWGNPLFISELLRCLAVITEE